MTLVAFSAQQQVFPVYNNLQNQTNETCIKSVNYSIKLTSVIYIWFAILGMLVYGTNLNTNIFQNLSLETANWESYFLRLIFLMVIGCHIPFIFFGGKESILIIMDEI